MTDERFEEIIKDKTKCEFCVDLGDEDICFNCKKVTPILNTELQEIWQKIKELNDLSKSQLAELLKYEQAEADGLLVRLPCEVGDTVYLRYMECDDPYNESHCIDWKDEDDNRSCESCPHRHPIAMPYPFNYADIPEVGKTVFLTREEAEQALKELEARKSK